MNLRLPARSLTLVASLVASAFLAGCAAPAADYLAPPVTGVSSDTRLTDRAHEEVTRDLIAITAHSLELRVALAASIEAAKAENPDPETNPVQSLEAYWDYIDWAAKAMPWSILPGVEKRHPKLYDRIDQSLNYFYYLNDRPLKMYEGRGLYRPTVQYAEPYRSWLISFTTRWGEFLNTTGSWSDANLAVAREDARFRLDTGDYEDPKNWKTFNQFFARYLADPSKRPIASPEDDSVLTSPADSTPQGIWRIDEKSNIVPRKENEADLRIKSGVFSSVSALLEGSEYADAFAGGTLTHTFLDVYDYHRYHFPVSGTVREVVVIPGDDAVGGWIEWDPKEGRYLLEADTPGWQMIETRAAVIVETESHGLVAILPIAMSQVSSVCFEDTVKPGAKVKKGDMLGTFLFGGSDIVMIFQKGVSFELAGKPDAEGGYPHIFMGEHFGTLR
ncbi:phosphatidylserine decarboxylase [Sutterella sp.]|uniref:phosphatidylserine decarboxylase n=1 Tax=Sutterella sp. TaxID=1981025 RepID=UPI0026E00DA2|nr:phosphatidylserine decarboxylase [Sutterella sp.]MDO5531174.1 phosphatidylserine decarboxylase [Sutterella sp.]